MRLKEIYLKEIDRTVNPAVSASDFSDETIKTEIEEYVFTDEIINELHKILSAIQARKYSHVGIWINGYFGSGKSHFLKYLGYCLNSKYRDRALERLNEAVEAADPLTNQESKSEVAISDMRNLSLWLKDSEVDIILFNIGTVQNSRSKREEVFLDVLWNQFNAFRGYNKFNLALAQHFEKILDREDKFEEFKKRVENDGFNWEVDAADLAINELDYILEIGKELYPNLSIDVIRDRIANDNTYVSVETFSNELKSYLEKKDDKYRLIFLVDEVSQFINARTDLLLQLQEIVTRLKETCESKVWVAATAQQDLQEILQACQINETSDDYGKIMGRFEVKVSLTGTQPEYITQKRILEKSGAAGIELGKLYENKKNAITAQFQLPSSYKIFDNKEEFINYYPFVPYQFRLIMQVFNSFVDLGFVDKEVKGNERSIIKVTHSTAKHTKGQKIGDFISFNQFFGPMFKGALVAKGQKAMKNANEMIQVYEDKVFGQQVVNTLFMICNLSQTDRLLFPATVDNITTLLMKDVDTQKLALKEETRKVLEFLRDENILRVESQKPGLPEIYSFFSEDETEVAQIIKSQTIDNNTMAEELGDILMKYALPKSRESYMSSNFSVGATIMGRNFLTNNADLKIEFVMDSDFDTAEQYAFKNTPKQMAFFIADLYREERQLKNDFYWYCQVEKYLKNNQATTELRLRTHNEFKQRALEVYKQKIDKPFKKMFDACTVVSGMTVIQSSEMGQVKGEDRYKRAIEKHISKVYPYASLVKNLPASSSELKSKILRPINANDYALLSLSDAEQQIENYLSRGYPEINVKDVVQKFSEAPYGWNEASILHLMNELVRRRVRDFSYKNNQHVERQTIADKLMSEQQNFTIRAAQKISQDVIKSFIESWRDIFNKVAGLSIQMDAHEIDSVSKDLLHTQHTIYANILSDIGSYPFAQLMKDWNKLSEEWTTIREPESFFKRVVADREKAKELMDNCKQIREFYDDQFGRYKEFLDFIHDNNYNFDELDGCDSSIAAMRELKTDPWPIEKMPHYKKLRDELRAKLEELKENLRKRLKEIYSEEIKALNEVAEQQGVKYSIITDNIVSEKSRPDNIPTLKNNLNTDSFYQQETAKIIKLKGEKTPPDNKGGVAKTKPVKQVTLKTRTAVTIKSEKDVENYLSKLKEQLMDHLSDGDEVMIL